MVTEGGIDWARVHGMVFMYMDMISRALSYTAFKLRCKMSSEIGALNLYVMCTTEYFADTIARPDEVLHRGLP